jgi:hypothetical protein
MKAKKQVLEIIGAAVVAGGTALSAQQIKQAQQRMYRTYRRWHPITVNRDIADITLKSKHLKPLMDLGNAIEVLIAPAPGGRGTEIAARLTEPDVTDKASRDLLAKMRAALRNTQWLVETGEILKPDKPPSTHRTLTSLPLEFAVRRAREGGRL